MVDDSKCLIEDYAYYRAKADAIAEQLEEMGYTGYYVNAEKKGLLDPGTRPTEFVWEKADGLSNSQQD